MDPFEEIQGDVEYLNWTVESGRRRRKPFRRAYLCSELWPGLPLFLVLVPSGLKHLVNITRVNWDGPSVLTDNKPRNCPKGLSLKYLNYFLPVW